MELMKESIKNLKEYKVINYDVKVKLDANEGRSVLFDDIFSDLNLNAYPDSDSISLRKEISRYIDYSYLNIIAGNGSSEMIELIMKTFLDKDEIVLSFTPSFSMYNIFTKIYSGRYVNVSSNDDFSVSIDKLIKKAKEINPKIILVCNPNNPTGYLLKQSEIKELLNNTNSIVVVDEAYIEFGGDSMVKEVENYPNLIVLRTLSKAFSLAGIRLGYMASNEKIIKLVNKIKSPYNLNTLSQYVGINALNKEKEIKENIKEIIDEREKLYKIMKELNINVYKSHANFLFFSSNVKNLKEKLIEKDVLIRSFSGNMNYFYRVSIGSKEENNIFINALKEILKYEKV